MLAGGGEDACESAALALANSVWECVDGRVFLLAAECSGLC